MVDQRHGSDSSMIVTRTPLRVSFVGGGTDLPAFYEREGGAVLSTAITRYVYVTVKRHSELSWPRGWSTMHVRGQEARRWPMIWPRPEGSLLPLIIAARTVSTCSIGWIARPVRSAKPSTRCCCMTAFPGKWCKTLLARIRQITSSNAQQIVWVEMRLQPK